MNLYLLFKNKVCFLLLFLISHNLTAQIQFSDQEKQWISQNPVIKIGADNNWAPFEFVDESGRHVGMAADYISLIEEKTGLDIQIKPGSWESIFDKAQNHQLDGLSSMVKTSRRQAKFFFTNPYITVPLAIITRIGYENISDVNQLSNKSIAITRHSYLKGWLTDNYPNSHIYLTDSNEDSIKAVA